MEREFKIGDRVYLKSSSLDALKKQSGGDSGIIMEIGSWETPTTSKDCYTIQWTNGHINKYHAGVLYHKVPEYVRCIRNPSWGGDITIGDVFKTDTAGYPEGKYRILLKYGGQTTDGNEHCFEGISKKEFDRSSGNGGLIRLE